MIYKRYSYKKGIKTPKLKNLSLVKKLDVGEPKMVYISTKQAKGVLPVVSCRVGDSVLVGSVVASIGDNKILSSVSGKVVGIKKMPSVFGGFSDCVVIKNDMQNESINSEKLEENQWVKTQIENCLSKSQLVDYDGEVFVNKLKGTEKDSELKNVVVNFLTDEPFGFTNYVLLKEYLDDIFVALKVLRGYSNLKTITFAIPRQYSAFVNTIKEKLKVYTSVAPLVKIASFEDRYPLGDSDILFSKLSKNNDKNNPRKYGWIIVDAVTLLRLKKIIVDGKTADTCLLSVFVDGVKNFNPIYIETKIGTSIKELVESAKGDSVINKIVAGGPMRGVALGVAGAPTTTTLKSLFLDTKNVLFVEDEVSCNKCLKCVKACPHKLIPYEIELASINNDFVMAKNWGANKCTKCGCCGAVCPSKRHIMQRIAYSKDQIKKRGI